ncbi:MAG: PDGLE domain-containing protein [Planctomycetes bacterium]|nr:PDGLE domain-containing protein [Planctomycetota bacterium]
MSPRKGTAFLIALSVAVVVAAWWASAHPDGLEWVMGRTGAQDGEHAIGAPLADYRLPWLGEGFLSHAAAALAGLAAVLALGLALGRVLRWTRSR